MTDKELLALGEKVVRTEFAKRGRYQQCDWEDVRQEVLLALLIANQRHPGRTEGYYYAAGKNAVLFWFRRHQWAYCEQRLPQCLPAQPQNYRILSPDMKTSLRSIFVASSTGPLKRRLAWADSQIRYLALIIEGYSMEGIALALGMPSIWVAYAQRRRCLRHLQNACSLPVTESC